MSTLSSFGLDLWFNRHLGLKGWILSTVQDTTCLSLGMSSTKKDEDIVVIEAEEDVNGESVQRDMVRECQLQRARTWLAGIALSMGIVGLWGDRK